MIAGFACAIAVLNFSTAGAFAVHWNTFFLVGLYLASFSIHFIYWRLNSRWRESSKYQTIRYGGVAFMPTIGPLVSLIVAPVLLVMPLAFALLIYIECRMMSAEPSDVKFSVVRSYPDAKNKKFEHIEINSESDSIRFTVVVDVPSPYDGASVLNGKVFSGIFGNQYLLKLSR